MYIFLFEERLPRSLIIHNWVKMNNYWICNALALVQIIIKIY